MLRPFLLTVGAALIAGSALAQRDYSSRLHTVVGDKGRLRYDMATRSVLPAVSSYAFFGPNKLYNNTCPQPVFLGLAPGEQVLDSGQAPSRANRFAGVDLGSCDCSYKVNGFQVSYCSNQPSNDLVVTLHEQYEACTDISASPLTAGILLAGLPGSNSGAASCYIVDIDLSGTSLEFTLAGDGDGLWDDEAALDTFGYTFEFLNITGSAVGPVVAGGTVILGGGCDWGVDVIFEQGDPSGSSPNGTGWGSTDSFGLQDTVTSALVGCFFFGGYPANPYASFHFVLYTEADCGSPITSIVCDGSFPGSCPCGNESVYPGGCPYRPASGCLNSGGGSVGGTIDVPPIASLSMGDLTLTVSYPAGNSSLLMSNLSGVSPQVPVFDGIACVVGGPRLFPGGDNGVPPDAVALDGLRTFSDVWAEMNTLAPGFVTAGGTYDFQCWYRDVLSGGPSPCGTNANFTSARSVLAVP